ncbi:carboxypeptidase-like regulatory domain-containing protein [Clostridioides difficile]
MSKIDLYNLKASNTADNINESETTFDLKLTTSTTSQEGIIQGTVTSGTAVLPDATVKVFSSDGVPLYHANTGANGQYVISGVTKGSYLVTAAKQGYLTPAAVSVPVVANQPTTVPINLLVDSDATLNTLYGKILTPGASPSPIPQATVNVYKVATDSTRTIIASTRSNESGQYLFPYLVDGNYIIQAIKANYISQESATVTLSNAVKSSLNLFLTPLVTASYGTVSGFISDSVTGIGIPNAVVALYKVVNNVETIVQQTKTNANGRYLFGNVEDGTYRVKAFAQTNAPTA